MKKITLDEVKKLARLSRIDIGDKEAEALLKDLNEILEYVNTLAKVDTAGLKPTSQVTGLTNRTRPDKEEDYGAKPRDLMAGAPKRQDGYIKVGKVL